MSPEGVILLAVGVSVVVGIPTVGTARRSRRDGRERFPWTLSMLAGSLLVPIFGSILVWVIYAMTAESQ